MHIATIAQIAHRAGFLGATHPALPGFTLVRTSEGFALEDLTGNRQPLPASLPRDGWEEVKLG